MEHSREAGIEAAAVPVPTLNDGWVNSSEQLEFWSTELGASDWGERTDGRAGTGVSDDDRLGISDETPGLVVSREYLQRYAAEESDAAKEHIEAARERFDATSQRLDTWSQRLDALEAQHAIEAQLSRMQLNQTYDCFLNHLPPVGIPLSQVQYPRKIQKFTLFPGLPVELRIKIWKLASPGPQIVWFPLVVRLLYHGSELERCVSLMKENCDRNKEAVKLAIGLNLVCRESYEVLGLRIRRFEAPNLGFAGNTGYPSALQVYVNLKVDTLLVHLRAVIDPGEMPERRHKIFKSLRGARRVVLFSDRIHTDIDGHSGHFDKFLSACPSVEKLTICVSPCGSNDIRDEYEHRLVEISSEKMKLLSSKATSDFCVTVDDLESLEDDIRKRVGQGSAADMKLACYARRRYGSRVWMMASLSRADFDMWPHRNWEPVIVDGESFRLYTVDDPSVSRGDLCTYCHDQRWFPGHE